MISYTYVMWFRSSGSKGWRTHRLLGVYSTDQYLTNSNRKRKTKLTEFNLKFILFKSNDLWHDKRTRCWYLSYRRTAKDLTSLCNHAVSTESSLYVHTNYQNRLMFRLPYSPSRHMHGSRRICKKLLRAIQMLRFAGGPSMAENWILAW